MALINCPDCSKRISEHAPTCPGCGAPIARATIGSDGDALVTTQATAKTLKAQQAISTVVFLVGMALMFAGSGTDMAMFGAVIMVLGIIGYVASRLRIWWHHE